MCLAEMIRKGRARAGLSQSALARRLSTVRRPGGIWPTYVGQIEKGDKVPSDEVCLGLAAILGLEAEEVLLAAYRDRADSQEARELFERMQHILADPRARQLAAKGTPPEAELLALLQDAELFEALRDPDVRAALQDREWRAALARVYRARDGRPVLALLARLDGLSARQWRGLMAILEGMGA